LKVVASSLIPPIARIAPQTAVQHGRTLVDNYAWLQNRDDPQVIAYLEAENAYAHALLEHTEPLQEQLFAEMRGRIQEDDQSAPVRREGFFYYWRMEAGKQYRVFCRRGMTGDTVEQILWVLTPRQTRWSITNRTRPSIRSG
jgi:oligopeptidase B